jgi:hypothetical protein
MRIFQMLQQLELKDGERLVGVYLDGARYTCRDDDTSRPLTAALDAWLAAGAAKLIEAGAGPGPAQVSGTAQVREAPTDRVPGKRRLRTAQHGKSARKAPTDHARDAQQLRTVQRGDKRRK